MRATDAGSPMTVAPDEEFGVLRQDHATSGYDTLVSASPGIVHVGSNRRVAEGFGGGAYVLERFRCLSPGTHRIEFVESRSFGGDVIRTETTITCR